ncbi:MAG: T9SS type A sorting domain-containing protein [Bacteroidota bacterium]
MTIRDIQTPANTVGQFEKWELLFQLDATYDNPYDPDDIRVDGHIRMPSGKEVQIPAFYYEPYQSINGRAQMMMGVRYNRTGSGEWRLRFSSPETGNHSLVVTAREKSGRAVSSETIHFEIAGSSRSGFVQVSQENPLYFENSGDKSLFWGVGTNVAWTRSQDPGNPPSYEYYFGKAKGNMNATRVWLCHWAWLEWTPYNDQPGTNWADYSGAGYYNQMIAETVDRIFFLAEAQNLRIMLVTEDNNEHFDDNSAGGWAGNPYNKIFGGPCDTPNEIFSLTEARNLYRKRLRYILARWGYSDCLWVINSWNDKSNPDETAISWIKEMRDYVHNVVDGWRPIVYGSNFRYEATEVTDYAQAGANLVPTKPNVRQEGYHSKSDDWFKHSVLEQTWLGLTRGLAAWMVWPHVQVDRTNSWNVFRPAMEFAATQKLNSEGWQMAKATVRKVRIEGIDEDNYESLMEFVTLQAYGDVPEWGIRSPNNIFEVDLNAVGGQWLEGFSRTLYATNRPEWRNPPTFVANLPSPGIITVEFFEIGSGTNQVVIMVNGQQAASHTFLDGRRYLSEAEGRISAELPAGEVEIFVDITSGDWARMRTVYISWQMQSPTQLVRIEGQTHAGGGFLYLNNKTYDRNYQEVLGMNPATLHDLQLDVEGLEQGIYRMRQIIPETGEIVRNELVNSTKSGVPLTMEVLNQSGILAFDLDDQTSTESIKNPADFIIYPNPFNNQLNIDLKKFSGNELTIELYSISGTKILSEIYKHQLGQSNHLSLNVGNLAKGTYILKIQNHETIYNQAVVKK